MGDVAEWNWVQRGWKKVGLDYFPRDKIYVGSSSQTGFI